MSFLWRTIKTTIMWKHLSQYKIAKVEALNFTPHQHYAPKTRRGLGKLTSLYLLMQTEGNPERFVWLGCKSFTGGILLSWIFFMFCTVAFRMSLKSTTGFSALMATLLSFMLSFSSVVRCNVLLLLPQLFSKRGRQTLMAYAFLLAVTGPTRNSTHNLRILSNSLACGQEQVKKNMKQVIDMAKEPIHALKESLTKLKENMERIVQPVKDVVLRLTRTFTAIFGVIKNIATWLGSIVSVCNKKIGTPYQRCVRSLDDAIDDCKVKLGIMQFLCGMVSAVKPLCYAVKAVDVLCALMDIVSDNVVALAKRRLAVFRQQVMDLLAVSIEVEHSVKMEESASKSVKDMISAIVVQVERKMENIKFLFKISIMVPGFALILLILKVQYYRHKYLTADHYDNRYISRRLVEIDLTRIRKNLETVLPLELHERTLYTTATSLTLVKGERKRLYSACLFLIITTIQVNIYLLADYGIHWTLLAIRRQGLDTGIALDAPVTKVDIQGSGTLAELYKQLGNAFQPESAAFQLDPVPCLPEPSPPDFRLYIQIGFLLGASWVLAIAEPYCLRLRHVVMNHYYPQRASQRAVWLHSHILLSRGPFTVFSRNRIRNRPDLSTSIGTILQKLAHRSAIMGKIFGKKILACASCATLKKSTNELIQCPAPGCRAIYCPGCLKSLSRCIICYEPLGMGGGVELDELEAMDSSEDEEFEDIEAGYSYDDDYPDSELSENASWTHMKSDPEELQNISI